MTDLEQELERQIASFTERYEHGSATEPITGAEALQRFQQIVPRLEPSQIEQAAEAAFTKMSPELRERYVQLIQPHPVQGAASANDPHHLAEQTVQVHSNEVGGLAAFFLKDVQRGSVSERLDDPLTMSTLGGIAVEAAKLHRGLGTGSDS